MEKFNLQPLHSMPQERLPDAIIERLQRIINKAPTWAKWVLKFLFKELRNIIDELELRKQ